MDINLPPQTVRGLTKRFFRHIEKTMEDGKFNFQFWNKDITQMFKPLDEKRLCGELATGESHMSYQYLIRKNKLSRGASLYLKNKHFQRMTEK
jgi:hypothetical protein